MGDYDTADLAGELFPPDREFVGFAQGTLRAWNPETFENVVEVHGTQIEDLPVASGVEALTYAPGNVIMLTRWKPGSGRGAASYWIGMGGRVVFPGEGQGEAAIAFMTTTLAKTIVDELVSALLVSPAGQDLAAFVIGQRIHAAVAPNAASYNTPSNYTSLPDGPSISDVPVSSSGVALVGVQFRTQMTASPTNTNTMWMSYQVSGASSVSALDSNAKVSGIADTDAANITNMQGQEMAWSKLTGLNEGLHTFEPQYRANFVTSFAGRRMIVIGL